MNRPQLIEALLDQKQRGLYLTNPTFHHHIAIIIDHLEILIGSLAARAVEQAAADELAREAIEKGGLGVPVYYHEGELL